ncbi:MAG: Rrf2 family transcriptional regulator [Candidatus Brocadiia bacterium]
MKLSTRVRYGCRAMVDLALHNEDGPVPLEVLAREQHMPDRYLAKIIQDLRRSGLVSSVRGAGGGYVLKAPLDSISLLDIYEALEGPFCPVECLEDPAGCELVEECVTRDVWNEIQKSMTEVLESVTLADLVRRHNEKVAHN